MISRTLHRAVLLVFASLLMPVTAVWSITTQSIAVISAGVTVGGGSGASDLVITASPLGSQALFGKNMMIPVTITSASGATVEPNDLRVDIVYQLVDASGGALGPQISVPIQFIPGFNNGKALLGTAIVNRSDLSAVQTGGTIRYAFRARKGASDSVLGASGQAPAGSNLLASPFLTSIIDQFCSPVGPAGARVSAPDLALNDGRTAVVLPQGAVQTAGTLCIRFENSGRFPAGPLGAPAAAIYSVNLQDTSLVQPVQLVLSYPADLTGKVVGTNADPRSLGIYWLDEARLGGDWRPLSRADLDSTLHTLTGQTGHFSTFGLFAAGAIGTNDLRPAERIITPNGDGINDVAVFATGIDEVKIFDVRGRRIKSIPGPTPQWDGTDDSGNIVESGVYIYQFTSSGDRVSGVIAVAK